MPLDHYVTLGRSGLRVSPLCLGAMTFGEDLGWGSSVKYSEAIIDRYVALGGNFIDTANMYTKGHSEKIIGDHVGRDKARRDRLVLATKFSGNLYPGDPNGGGSNRKSIVAACEQSLRRLQTDYIDLYWLHNWDKHTPIDETMAALDDLVHSGKVRYLGVSDTPAWKVAEAQVTARFRGWTAFIGLQIEYSLLERTVEGELVPMARELGLGITPWSPLKSGILSGKYTRQNAGQLKSDRGQAARHHGRARRHRLGAGPTRRHLHDHRRAHARAARGQPEGARREARVGARRQARRAGQAYARLPRRGRAALPDAAVRRHHHQRRVGAHRAVRAEPARRPLLGRKSLSAASAAPPTLPCGKASRRAFDSPPSPRGAAAVRSGWWWSMALVLRWEHTWTRPRRTRSRSSSARSPRSPSPARTRPAGPQFGTVDRRSRSGECPFRHDPEHGRPAHGLPVAYAIGHVETPKGP